MRFSNSRRNFLKLGVVASGGLAICCTQGKGAAAKPSTDAFHPNVWLTIDPDNSVTIVVAESEMGQGVLTSMSMLVADELEVDWKQVRVKQAPVDPVYGWQGTGGSRSVREGWRSLREAGAAARDMLIAAAAKLWNVPQG